MSKLYVTALVSLFTLALPVIVVSAQAQGARVNEGRVVARDDVPTCSGSGGATRTRANCEPETLTIRTEQKLDLSIELPQLPRTQCEAVAVTNYQQRNTVARVASTFSIADCTVASGTFTVALRVRDASGETKPLEFSETWQRSDDGDVKFTADYPIGENVELIGARVRNLRCTCADPPEGE